MALAAQQLLRADALLRDELIRVHDARSEMPPAVKASVCTVLTSLSHDPDLNPNLAAEARRVLDALVERPIPRQPRQHLGLGTIRLRAA